MNVFDEADPAVADLLAPLEPPYPPYPFGTTRPSLEQGYYECFSQPNVHLVDLQRAPIERVKATGVRTADGQHHDLDVLVLATGFDANTGGLAQIDIAGPSGDTLTQRWSDGVETQFGMAANGFPTCCSSMARRARQHSATVRLAQSCRGTGPSEC